MSLILRKVITLTFFVCSFISYAFALPQDKKAKIYVIADSSIFNYKTGLKIFEGHVHIKQGSTHLKADKVITKNDAQHQIKEAIAYGLEKQAHYWTLPKTGEPEMHAQANIIKFYPIDSNIVLEEQVTLTQAKNSFRGQIILYNMKTQTITIPPASQGHAQLIYHTDSR